MMFQTRPYHALSFCRRRLVAACMILRAILLIPVATLSLLLTGCVAYIPPLSTKPIRGKAITRRDAEFIRTGTTTRAEVIGILGTEYRDSPRIAALAYSWERPGGHVIWQINMGYGGAEGVEEVGSWRALFLAFDSGHVVTRKEWVHLKGSASLDEQLEKWAGWKPPNGLSAEKNKER
jgi:hypothetical protein